MGQDEHTAGQVADITFGNTEKYDVAVKYSINNTCMYAHTYIHTYNTKGFMMHLWQTDGDESGDVDIYGHRVGTGTRSCRDAGNSPGSPSRSVCTERGAYSR